MSYDINIHPRLVYQYLLLGSQHKEIEHESIDFEYEREIERMNELFQFPMHLYLKLHGSVNWWCCSRKDCPQHFRIHCDPLKYGDKHSKDNKFYRDFSDYSPSCQSCGSPMELVILAPNLVKPFDRFPRLQILWHKAADAIAAAKRIVVLGYSFSPTDLMTNFLFRINTQKQSPEKNWIIVDCDEANAKRVKKNLLQVLPYRDDVQETETRSGIVEWLSKN